MAAIGLTRYGVSPRDHLAGLVEDKPLSIASDGAWSGLKELM
jgi:hypothetical protein